jgi:hypothetical protein
VIALPVPLEMEDMMEKQIRDEMSRDSLHIEKGRTTATALEEGSSISNITFDDECTFPYGGGAIIASALKRNASVTDVDFLGYCDEPLCNTLAEVLFCNSTLQTLAVHAATRASVRWLSSIFLCLGMNTTLKSLSVCTFNKFGDELGAAIVNANTVDAGVLPSDETDLSANSDGKSSSTSRNRYLYLWVALAVVLIGDRIPMCNASMNPKSGGGSTLLESPAIDEELNICQQTGKRDEISLQASCSSLRNIRIAIAYDSSFCATFGGADGAKREVERIVAMASSWYSGPGLCVQLQLVSLEGHCNSRTDPYNRGDIASGSPDGMLGFFANYWHTNRSNVSRDTAHLFRTQSFTNVSVGCAFNRSLCSSRAYGVNAFPPNLSAVQRASIFAHELGHNAGADDLYTTVGKSIMEQILQKNVSKDGFSQASKDEILNYMNRPSVSCIESVVAPAPPGDDCGNDEIFVEIKLKTDNHAAETSLALTRSDGSAVTSGRNGSENNRAYTLWYCVPANDCYTVTINESEGDGMCCGYGQGSFEVNVEGQRIGGGGEFGFQDSVSFGRCSVEVGLSLRTDGYPEGTRVSLTNQSTGERLWSYSFSKANTKYRAFASVDPKGCYVFEVTDSFADDLRWKFGSGGFDLIYDERVLQSGTSFGSCVSYNLGEGC